ncbi:hypothetical protein F511_09992 [Dorcoceras hygrometricum]|uniref:Uncharacterized protein n=1 Tax=Dorcoceras hygrometricum TaxID=472368 RepID=A0A2Z7AK50_9LAMI|nr:hypothetical protein F511_09992 [Dorcoceras hygrometricum]
MTSSMTSSTTNPSAESQHDVASVFALRFICWKLSADCDDIKADVITAHSISSANSHLLISNCSFLLNDDVTADVIYNLRSS